jgi:hypothetical protein
MLKRTFEWLRVVEPRPDNQLVEGRSKAVAELLAQLDQARDDRLLGSFLAGAIAGFEGRFEPDSHAVAVLVASIRKFQAAFPSDLTENALDLRVSSLLAIGELFARAPKKGTQADRTLAAALVLSGSGIRPEVEGRHLRQVLAEVLSEGDRVIQEAAVKARARQDLDLSEFDEVTATGDTVAFWNELRPILSGFFEVVEERAKADREELEVLWWFYRAFSESFQKSIASLDPFAAALASGVEVGGRVLLPPHSGLIEMVAEASVRGRKKNETAAKALATVAAAWGEAERRILVPTERAVRDFVLEFPTLLPISWLCVRLVDSGGTPGWEREFESKTGIPADLDLAPSLLAKQAFSERVAQRLLDERGSE